MLDEKGRTMRVATPVPSGSGRPLPPPTPPPRRSSAPPPLPLAPPKTGEREPWSPLAELLVRRVRTSEKLGAREHAFAKLEVALFELALRSDRTRARGAAEEAHRLHPEAGVRLLRRLLAGTETSLPELLEHLSEELIDAEGVGELWLLSEKARIEEALSRADDANTTWGEILRRAPLDPAAMLGRRETLLRLVRREPSLGHAFLDHTLAEAAAYADIPSLAAACHVERARFFEDVFGQADLAKSTLKTARTLDPTLGPALLASLAFAARVRDLALLADLLEEAAARCESETHAALYELEAAELADVALRDPERSLAWVVRADTRQGLPPNVQELVLSKLIFYYERLGRHDEELFARKRRLHAFGASDKSFVAREWLRVGQLEQARGDLLEARASFERAHTLFPTEHTFARLDHVLKEGGHDEARVALHVAFASRTRSDERRTSLLKAAAEISERNLKRPDDAQKHLRAAWISSPGDPELVRDMDRLIVLSGEHAASSVVDLYEEAAARATDPTERIAYLERAAIAAEALVRDPKRALRHYEGIVAQAPERHSAWMGIARAAEAAGDMRRFVEATLKQASLVESVPLKNRLRLRAARELFHLDPSAAHRVLDDILEDDPHAEEARGARTALFELEGATRRAIGSMEERARLSASPQERAELWTSAATLAEELLRDIPLAERLFGLAFAESPHVATAETLFRLASHLADPHAACGALSRLDRENLPAAFRLRVLLRLASLEEFQLEAPERARKTLERALSLDPQNVLLLRRLERNLFHQLGRALEDKRVLYETLANVLVTRIPLEPEGERVTHILFETEVRCTRLDPSEQVPILFQALAQTRRHPVLLRYLFDATLDAEPEVRRRALEEGAHAVGALGLSFLHRNAAFLFTQPNDAFERILERCPNDPSALWARCRALLRSPTGEGLLALSLAFERLTWAAPSPGASHVLRALHALFLERATDSSSPLGPHYKSLLRKHPLSVLAAARLRKWASESGDPHDEKFALLVLCDLVPEEREECLLRAAQIHQDLGGPEHEVQVLLERALAHNPASHRARDQIVALFSSTGQIDALFSILERAFASVDASDAMVRIGLVIGKLAREHERFALGITTLTKVTSRAPETTEAWMLLAELYVGSRNWHEAIRTLEHVAEGHAPTDVRLTALFGLHSIHEKMTGDTAQAERVLRTVLRMDPHSERALSALVRLHIGTDLPKEIDPHSEVGLELEALLQTLAASTADSRTRSHALLSLSQLHRNERELATTYTIDAILADPSYARAFAYLASLFRGEKEGALSYQRALSLLVDRGARVGTEDARWLFTLGQLELGEEATEARGREHLRHAVSLDDALVEARFELADSFLKGGFPLEATEAIAPLFVQGLSKLSDPSAAVFLLQQSLEQAGQDPFVGEALLWLAGERDEAPRAARASLGNKRVERPALVRALVPEEARHILLEVGACVTGWESKVFRQTLADLGTSSKERPKAGWLRTLFEREKERFGISDVELSVSSVQSTLCIAFQENPWIVIPTAATRSEPLCRHLVVRGLVRLALGAPYAAWPQGFAFLVANARTVIPTYGAALPKELLSDVQTLQPTVTRCITRKQKQLLQELVFHLEAPEGSPPDPHAFAMGLAQAESRGALLLAGSFEAMLGEVALTSGRNFLETRALETIPELFSHSDLSDSLRFLLSPAGIFGVTELSRR